VNKPTLAHPPTQVATAPPCCWSPHPTSAGMLARRKGVGMADKSPRKVASKKSGKTLKEKRRDKKDKQQVRKGLII
jgi:hypothetical protein